MGHSIRRRMLTPSLWVNPDLGEMGPLGVATYIGLIQHSDDQGKLPADLRILRAWIFPHCPDKVSEDDLKATIEELAEKKLIEHYEWDGTWYIRHPNWAKYQTINRPQATTYPDPDGVLRNVFPPQSRSKSQDAVSDESVTGHGQVTDEPERKEGKGKEENRNKSTSELGSSDMLGWEEKIKKLPPECEEIVRTRWMPHASLPASTTSTERVRFEMLDTLRLLHTQDRQPWETIGDIVEYVAQHWYPHSIGSPRSLRDWTDKKDRKRWEAALGQLNASQSGGDPDAALADLMSKMGIHD